MEQLDVAVDNVPEESYTVPLNKAKVVREGKDVTIVGIQMMTHYAFEAAERLAKDGIEAEVIDLRSLASIDKDTIIESVKKTHRLLVVAEEAFFEMEAPISRLAIPDVPIPYSGVLEDFVIPGPNKIYEQVKKMMDEA